jgi:hypothetical protein
VPCARWFDAVRIGVVHGIRAVGRLRDRSGPVVEDQAAGLVTWLVAPGAADGWALPGVTVLGAGGTLAVPPASWTDGPALRWLVPPPVVGDCLTEPDALRVVLGGTCRA